MIELLVLLGFGIVILLTGFVLIWLVIILFAVAEEVFCGMRMFAEVIGDVVVGLANKVFRRKSEPVLCDGGMDGA